MTEKKRTKSIKILYMIFSVAVAISLWTYVVYIENPMLDKPIEFDNVPVELIGEEYLRDYNLIVSDVDVRELTVYFNGRIRDAAAISAMSVRAVVDLSDILRYSTPTGTHSLSYTLEYDSTSSTVTVEDASRPVIEVTVERLVTETFTVKPVFQGSIADGYMAGDLTLSRDSVEISGTEAAIGRISSATVTMNRENLSKTVTDTGEIKLFDEDGQEINMEDEELSFVNSDGTSIITQKILMVKELALVVDIIESATANSSNISINIDPPTIKLSGDPEDLEPINSITVGSVDLKSFLLSFNENFQIRIPNNTQNLSGVSTANVTISMTDSSIGLRRLSASNIGYRNLANDANKVTIITESLDITLRGNEESLAEVTAENIRIIADLSECAMGTSTAPARVYVDGFDDVEAVGPYSVTVTIS